MAAIDVEKTQKRETLIQKRNGLKKERVDSLEILFDMMVNCAVLFVKITGLRPNEISPRFFNSLPCKDGPKKYYNEVIEKTEGIVSIARKLEYNEKEISSLNKKN